MCNQTVLPFPPSAVHRYIVWGFWTHRRCNIMALKAITLRRSTVTKYVMGTSVCGAYGSEICLLCVQMIRMMARSPSGNLYLQWAAAHTHFGLSFHWMAALRRCVPSIMMARCIHVIGSRNASSLHHLMKRSDNSYLHFFLPTLSACNSCEIHSSASASSVEPSSAKLFSQIPNVQTHCWCIDNVKRIAWTNIIAISTCDNIMTVKTAPFFPFFFSTSALFCLFSPLFLVAHVGKCLANKQASERQC